MTMSVLDAKAEMESCADASRANADLRDLHLAHLDALYGVSQLLSRSLDYRETVREVLRILDESAALGRGLISVLEPDGSLLVQSVRGVHPASLEPPVRYQSGEGVLGFVMEKIARSFCGVCATSGVFPTRWASMTRSFPSLPRR
ncbi:MAG: hypothetical protein LBD68_09665 [Zoogloeaceae bacterium]|jgi:transcriptional regulator with GAF, ATPase, and Fis domain|nr:hypothetical protein [Zoogloeaceae bacterium]